MPELSVIHWSQQELSEPAAEDSYSADDVVSELDQHLDQGRVRIICVTETDGDALTRLAQLLGKGSGASWEREGSERLRHGRGTGILWDPAFWVRVYEADPFAGINDGIPEKGHRPHTYVRLQATEPPHHQLAILTVHLCPRYIGHLQGWRANWLRGVLCANLGRLWRRSGEAKIGGRLLVTGDFNDEPWDGCLRAQINYEVKRSSPEYLHSAMGLLERDDCRFVGTWRPPAESDEPYPHRWYALDGVLVSGGLLQAATPAGAAWGLRWCREDTAVLTDVRLSDHLPLRVALNW